MANHMLSDEQIKLIRADLPVISSYVYMNAGTLGPLPQPAIEAMRREFGYDSQIRQGADLWERLGAHQEAARQAGAKLTGVSTDGVALMHTTHAGINTCLWGLNLQAGDEVVTTDQEHPGVTVPLRHVRDRSKCKVRVAEWLYDDSQFVEEVAKVLSERTRAVVISHVSWVTGWVAPLAKLRAALPEGCCLIVDGAQSGGVYPTSPSDDGWDAYTISGQKWTCGPNGSGILALTSPNAWLPTFGAYMQVDDPYNALTSATVHSDARRFEFSQEAMLPLAGFTSAIDWLYERVGGPEAARGHAISLNKATREIWPKQLERYTSVLYGDHHLLCAELTEPVAERVVAELSEMGISIRSLSPTRLRLSLGAWNTIEEVEQAVHAIRTTLTS